MTMSAPPPQPAYVLRGHEAQIHSLFFLRRNARLLSGDADGYVVLWNLAMKRPAGVWRPHIGAILGVGSWGSERVITHGRDDHLRVWQLKASEESQLSTALPVDGDAVHRKEPWLLHALQVNTLNFCSFASCQEHGPDHSGGSEGNQAYPPSLLVAVLSAQDDSVDVWQLPTEQRLHTIRPPSRLAKDSVGMVMALRILYSTTGTLHVISGHESGLTAVRRLDPLTNRWTTIYLSRPHSQPILSLDIIAPDTSDQLTYFTSGADAAIVAHVVPLPAAAPSDSEIRQPARQVNTGHAGQQSLTVRSDARILATAGWDGRARVYSARSLRELAVLKWHAQGCYAVAFAEVLSEEAEGEGQGERQACRDGAAEEEEEDEGRAVQLAAEAQTALSLTARPTVRQRRERKVQQTHWIAAGAKDGKISLWEVY